MKDETGTTGEFAHIYSFYYARRRPVIAIQDDPAIAEVHERLGGIPPFFIIHISSFIF
jgi:hypothetical protein